LAPEGRKTRQELVSYRLSASEHDYRSIAHLPLAAFIQILRKALIGGALLTSVASKPKVDYPLFRLGVQGHLSLEDGPHRRSVESRETQRERDQLVIAGRHLRQAHPFQD
jgi:hypothetical protein